MRILLTGGAGFIGSHVADRLLQRGDVVTVVDDFNDYYAPEFKRQNIAAARQSSDYHLAEGDITDMKFLRATVKAARPDVIIHLAARAGVRPSVANPGLYQRVNVEGTLNALECARELGVRKFVLGSTSSVYGLNARVPFREDDALLRIVSPYAATKLGAEALCQSYAHLHGMEMAVLRFFSVYGSRGRPDMAIYQFTERILGGHPITLFGDGSSERDYTHVDDIVQGVLAATVCQIGFEIFNLGESQTTSLRHLVELIEGAVGRKAVIERLPDQPGDVPRTFADISKSQRLLDYRPTMKIAQGIPLFVEWFLRERASSVRGAA